MKVLVIGASGGTGQLAVKKLLARGDDVTAFVRDPASFKEQHAKLTVVKGEARDAASFVSACKDVDAVLSAFGPRALKKDDVQAVFMNNLVDAMEKNGVKRLVNLSAWGAGDSFPELPLLFKIVAPIVLGRMLKDKEEGERRLFSSSLDYVNVRPGELIDKPARGGVKATLTRKLPDGSKLVGRMTRDDLADFMIAQLTSNDWVKKSPLIGY